MWGGGRTPLSASRAFSSGATARDYWTIALLGFGLRPCIGTAINIIATIVSMRCPGMKLSRMPLLAWLNLVMSGMFARNYAPICGSAHVGSWIAHSWRSFFRYAGRRFSPLVDALLLDIWASRGLCPDHSLLCVCFRNYFRFFHASQFRDIPSWWVPPSASLCEHERLGASHVYHRMNSYATAFSRLPQWPWVYRPGSRSSIGWYDVGADPVQDADVVLHRLFISF